MKETVQFLFKPASTHGLEELMDECNVRFLADDFELTEDNVLTLPSDASILATEFSLPVNKRIMDHFPNLKLIANYAVGFNNIDLHHAKERHIKVCNTPKSVVRPTAELTVGLILSATRRIAEWDRSMRSARANTKEGLGDGLGSDLYGKTVGIIGFGNIGQAVAEMLQGFGVKIIYNKRTPPEEKSEWTFASKEEVFCRSDIICLHTPYTQETHHLVNKDTLSQMKQTAILVNVARGAVVDEAALVEALKNDEIAGAAMDVFEFEDQPLDELYDLPNVVMTPHVGTQTRDARQSMAKELSNNILGFLNHDRPVAYVKLPE